MNEATGGLVLNLLEIDPPWRLVYTFRWEEPTPDDRETVVDLSLGSTGEATLLVLSQGPFLAEGGRPCTATDGPSRSRNGRPYWVVALKDRLRHAPRHVPPG